MKKNIAIAIEIWKLKIFKKHLDKAGFKFKKNPGITSDTLLLTVETTKVAELAEVVKSANTACARQKMN